MSSPFGETRWQRNIPFRVDIAGVIELMGSSLYTAIETPIRELVQNAHDGIIRRRIKDLSFTGNIRVTGNPQAGTLTISDDGIGLSEEQAEKFLGTLGIGLTGLIKGRFGHQERKTSESDNGQLIGQFGVGLFSAFMIADTILVESRRYDAQANDAIAWFADGHDSISLAGITKENLGTSVTLKLKQACLSLAEDPEIETTVCKYADWLTVPIFVGDSGSRSNQCTAPWLEATCEEEEVAEALEARFDETPLHSIPIRVQKPVNIQGAIYVSPRRTPGFTGDSTVTLTVRRMVIREDIDGMFPAWASMFRGVLEMPLLTPTTSREDVIRNEEFLRTTAYLEEFLFNHFQELAQETPEQLQRIITWHRYTFAGSAIDDAKLRQLLAKHYKFNTSHGSLSFLEILDLSEADPLFEAEADYVVWANPDRRQENWITKLFSSKPFPCVHPVRSFEETLLAMFVNDARSSGAAVDLRTALPSSKGFNEVVLNAKNQSEEMHDDWENHFQDLPVVIRITDLNYDQPALAFLNPRQQLEKSYDELRSANTIPEGFQRIIDGHLKTGDDSSSQHEVIICKQHPLVARALESGVSSPSGTLLRISVIQALETAGVTIDAQMREMLSKDMSWLAEII